MNTHRFSPRSFILAVFFAVLAMLTPAAGVTIEEALDAAQLTWQADPGWQGVATGDARDGVDAAQAVVSSGTVRLQTTVTGPGHLALFWQLIESDDEGYVGFEVDGVELLIRPGPFPWERLAVNVPRGDHTISVVVHTGEYSFHLIVDQAAWSPEQPLPVASALQNEDAIWLQQGDWQAEVGESRDGFGRSARLDIPGGGAEYKEFSLKSVVTETATFRYWLRITTATPGLYADGQNKPFPGSWTQSTRVIPGPPGRALFEIAGYASPQAAPAILRVDDLEVVQLTLASAVDLRHNTPEFLTSQGGNPWIVQSREADARGTGSVKAAPEGVHVAEMWAHFTGPGLLTWSWANWSAFGTTTTVTLNGAPLGVLTNHSDYASTFDHAAGLLTGTGTNSVLWRIKGGNGSNGVSLDDVLFSPAAAPGLREALEIEAGGRLFNTENTSWMPQHAITYDGTDALELGVTNQDYRAALTMPVTGPALLTWWWRSILPDASTFRLHRQGRAVRSIAGSTDWRQGFLALRAGQEHVRWERSLNGANATPFHRIWLDQVRVVPQTISPAEALDTPGQSWSSTGDVLAAAMPYPESNDGVDALVLTGPSRMALQDVFAESMFSGPGALTFRLRTQRGPVTNGDAWRIEVDGARQPFVRPPETDGWQFSQLPIASGNHTVRWIAGADVVVTLDAMKLIPGDGFSRWAQDRINEDQPAGPMDDPDGDGAPNLLEFAFDSWPLDARSLPALAIGRDYHGKPVLEFVRDIRHTDITWQAEFSRDLVWWTPVHADAAGSSSDGFIETMHAPLPAGRAFARVKIERKP
jgi:hypothetical protein